MTVTRNVVVDLFPIYLAGEASADTRALVEQYMNDDPGFAAEMRGRVERGLAVFAPAPDDAVSAGGPAPDHEKLTLERVRRFNRRRTYFLGLALANLLMPFSFTVGGGDMRWVMLRDNPKQAIVFWIASSGFWIAYYMMGRRLRNV